MRYTKSLLLLAAQSTLGTAVGGHCPPTGPVLPPPKYPAKFDPTNLSSQLNMILSSSDTKWNVSTTSFSVQLTSTDATVFEYHHTAPFRNSRGVAKVDGDTVYRICSITKTFNVLALLLNAPEKLDMPIGTYISELRDFEPYKDITLRMLTSQMSGVPRDGSAFDRYFFQGEELQKAGFPTLNPQDLQSCDNLAQQPCSRAQMFNLLKQTELDFLPADRAAYSNQAFMLTAWAMENITGKSFETILHDSIIDKLHLPNTGLQMPDVSKGILPVGIGSDFFTQDFGNFKYTAGLFSTPRDITDYTRAILNHTLLSAARTRQWLKSSVFAGSYGMYVGAPWEIFRLANLTPDRRPIDIYTKSGSVPGWSSYMFIIPDYNIGGTIMTAATAEDSGPASEALLDVVIDAVVRGADSLSRQQAKLTYVGQYGEGKNSSSSLEIVIDNGPGLRIKSWKRDNKSILQALAASSGVQDKDFDARLYPIGENGRWRMIQERITNSSATPSRPSQACGKWFNIDQWRYGGLPVDEFDFVMESGVVKSVVNPGLRSNLRKKPT